MNQSTSNSIADHSRQQEDLQTISRNRETVAGSLPDFLFLRYNAGAQGGESDAGYTKEDRRAAGQDHVSEEAEADL